MPSFSIFPQSLYKFTRIYISRGLFGSSCPKHASLYSQLRNRASKHPRYLTMATTMQKANRLKVAFDEGKGPSMGCWQMIPGSNVSRTLASTGVDWVLVDCEHGNMDDAAMHEAVPAIAACGVSPIVRIPDNQGFMVKRKSSTHFDHRPVSQNINRSSRLGCPRYPGPTTLHSRRRPKARHQLQVPARRPTRLRVSLPTLSLLLLSHINRLPAAIQRRDSHHGANRNKRSPPRR